VAETHDLSAWLDEQKMIADGAATGPWGPADVYAFAVDAREALPVLIAMVRAALDVKPLADPSFPVGTGERNALAEVRRAMANVLAETGEQAHG
jgi:hypothetical protein